MERRAFLALVPVGLLAAPLAAEAQQARKVHRIGFFGSFPLDPKNSNPHWNAFLEGLRDHGYVEGKNLEIVEKYTGGQPERLPIIATELVASGVSVIVANGPGPAKAAKEATEIIPIVFIGSSDPVGFGLVASLARPGRNVTGLASTEWEGFQAKQLQVIKEALPTASRVAILINPSTRMHALILPQEQEAAARLGVKIQLVKAGSADELENAFATAKRERADFVHVFGDPVVFAHRAQVAELALKHRLPTMHFYREAVVAGGLISLGPDWPLIFRNAGSYVDKILKGTKPANIPVAQPTKYDLAVNLKTAKALGLTIPRSLLLRADQVIE